MFGNIRQDDLCVDIEIGHVPAIAKLSECNSDRGTQVCTKLKLYIVVIKEKQEV